MDDLAWYPLIVALLKVLHRRDVPMDEVVAEFGNTLDFADVQHMDNPSREQQRALYEHLLRIAHVLEATEGKPPEGPSGP